MAEGTVAIAIPGDLERARAILARPRPIAHRILEASRPFDVLVATMGGSR